MKILLFAFTILFTIPSFAQKVIVQKQTETFGVNTVQCLTVFFDSLDYKEVSKLWISFLKNQDAKVKSNKDEFTADNAKFITLSNDTVDVYSKIMKSESGQLLCVSFQTKDGFISDNNQSASLPAAEKIIKDFALDVKKKQVGDKVSKQQEILVDVTKELNNLTKKNENLARDNEDMKTKISSNEKEIKENADKIESSKIKVSLQTKVVEQIREFHKKIE